MKRKQQFKSGGSGIVTPNSSEIFNRYMVEITKLKPISREEELELFKKIELNGDKRAIDIICKHNLLFVVSVARKYSKLVSTSRLTLEDLVNEGNLGLYTAISSFDYHTGNKFISYAVWYIKGYILNFISENIKSIRIPNSIISIVNKSRKQEEKLEQKLNRNPTTLEVFNSMVKDGVIKESYTESKLNQSNILHKHDKSLSSPVGNGEYDDLELADLIKCDDLEPETVLLEKERTIKIASLLNNIPDKIKSYFIDYFGLNGEEQLSITEMAIKYDEGRDTIKARIDKYIRKLKDRHRDNREYFYSNIK